MTLLILNVDRDDDLGRKAKVQTPIIGLDANLAAANKFGLVDPEDSDLNALFQAAATYKKLKDQGLDVEIATLSGDINVGPTSDTIIAEQLDMVISETQATECILISDGAEDEYILPIIQSRLKVNGVQRVNVKQSKHLEDAYYRVAKIMDDPKVRKQLLAPMALILIVWSIFAILGMAGSGLGAIVFTLGLYLFIRAYGWENQIEDKLHNLKNGLLQGKLSFYMSTVALIIVAISIFYGYNNTDFQTSQLWAIPLSSLLKDITWGVVLAGMIAIFGLIIDRYLHQQAYHNLFIFPFSILTYGFIANATFEALYYSLLNDYSIEPFLTPHFIGYTIVGILIALIGTITRHYLKENHEAQQRELEIETQTIQGSD